MSLSPAARLGPYEILSRLGAGAMGEVYRARDTRLGRDVAVKVLPVDFAEDPSRRARFEQEARAVAALNHPNILALYDIGSENSVSYIVTEFVSGETLGSFVERGPISTRKMLDIAVQIADGMAAAHATHITHRDLKPANIMISGDGRVKILDFGLAKQTVPLAADETVLVGHTQPGMILGTIDYMSPEQACGKPTDHRSDQFSLGLILYEMASGKKAFDRPEAVQTLSAILSEEPPPIERNVPGPLRWIIDRCLAKDPADRYDSTRDLFQELRSLRDRLSETSAIQAAPTVGPRRHIPWRLPAAFALGLLVPIALHLFLTDTDVPDQSSYQFTPFSFQPGGQFGALWSPDGKAVAYGARAASGFGPYQIFIRYLDQPTAVQITHSEEGVSPRAWTPDGKRLLMEIDSKPGIWTIAVVGGEPEMLVPTVHDSRVAAYSPDAKTIALLYPGDDDRYGVWISSPPGAAAQRYLPDPFAAKNVYNLPKMKFSPDGSRILLLVNTGRDGEEAWLLPFPPNPSHPPRRVLKDLKAYDGTPTFCWMPDNRHIVLGLASSRDATDQLWLADTTSGKRYALTSGTTGRFAPVVSPEGRRIIFSESTGKYDVVSVDLATAAAHPRVDTERDESMPAWAAKQSLLVYVTDRNGPQEIWLRAAGGTDRPLVTARDFPGENTQWFMGPALSPEGDRVIYTKVNQGGGANHLWISAVTGGAPVPVTNDGTSAEDPGSWSLDGSWFAYVAYREGRLNLMKVKTTGQATPVLVTADVSYDNEAVPEWSPDGQWIVLGDCLYSADGTNVRPLGQHHPEGYFFSRDGKLLYSLRQDGDREVLFSVDVAGGNEKIIGDVGREYRPLSGLNPAVRLSLAPDGKSFIYGTIHSKSNLWMLEGFAVKTSLLAHFGL